MSCARLLLGLMNNRAVYERRLQNPAWAGHYDELRSVLADTNDAIKKMTTLEQGEDMANQYTYMVGLTARQKKAYDFIRAGIIAGRCPAYTEIADHLGLVSKSGVCRLIEALIAKGYLEKVPHRARALALPVAKPAMKEGAVLHDQHGQSYVYCGNDRIVAVA